MSNSKNPPVSNPHFDEELEISDSEIEISHENEIPESESPANKFYASGYNSFGKKLRHEDEDDELQGSEYEHHNGLEQVAVPTPNPHSYEAANESQSDSEKDDEKRPRPSGAKPLPASSNFKAESSLSRSGQKLPEDVTKLFELIAQFTPEDIEMEPKMKPFIPDLIPAIGDIDPFIKIPSPDQKPSMLGVAMLDEPATQQSDPSVIDLQLRALSKTANAVPQQVRSLDSELISKDRRPLEAWIHNVKELHTQKPAASVHYRRRMPDLEDLMQQWPPEFEESLADLTLPSAELDIPLKTFCRLLALLLDIPCGEPKDGKSSKGDNQTIEAMHVLLSLYHEFKTSDHFNTVQPLL